MQDTCKIFFSWQSDVKESRNLISECLKKVPARLKDLAVIEVSRDTEGIAGAPNIGDTIFDKIEHADIFVADVSIINANYDGRKMPNPNVLIELGYAIKALGWERIVLVHNLDTGDVEQLPFDMNHQRVVAYSLREETKAKARDNIIKCVSMTLEILKEKRMLHGGQPDILRACQELESIIGEGMKSVHKYFVDRHFRDAEDEMKYFIPIPDVYFEKLELAKKRLTEQQYYEVSKILHKLQLASTGTSEAYGWEYAEELAASYFDGVYREYGEFMEELPWESVLTSDFIELLNAIAADSRYSFSKDRYCDGKLVFINDGQDQEAYDKEGNLLCKGTKKNGLFAGFRKIDGFVGEFADSKRHGEGKELTSIFGRKRYGCGMYRRVGTWADDKFVAGRIYSAVLTKLNENDWAYECDSYGEILTADDMKVNDFMHALTPEEIRRLYFADMILKDGKFEICEETVRAAADYENVRMLIED